jgi:lantibiotic modifying enzyme
MSRTRRSREADEKHLENHSGSPYLAAAEAIAEQLVDTVVPVKAGATWLGDDLLGEDEDALKVVRVPVGPHLYGGGAGIGWFLGHLAACTRARRTADVAVDALHFALDAATSQFEHQPMSLFSGASGVALTAVDLGGRLKRPQLRRAGLALAHRIAKFLHDRPDAVGETDLLGGLAGVVVGLLAIHRRVPEPMLLAACHLAGDRLLERRHEDGFGTSWPDRGEGGLMPGLCGLGHGTSGIAWALAELAWSAGGLRYQAVIEEALRYERGWFSAERCAWADLRQPSAVPDDESWPAWTTAWCHGAIGIGALRLRIYEATQDLTALSEATAAIQAARSLVAQAGSALRQSQISDVTLCHGLAGAVELMLLAYEVTGLRDHQRAARRAGDVCLSIYRVNQNRWTVGVRGGDTVPGLFLGLAGVGVTMMRLHDPGLLGSPMLPGRPAMAHRA